MATVGMLLASCAEKPVTDTKAPITKPQITIEGGQPQADYMEYLKLKSQSTDESGCVDWDYIKNNPKSVVSCYLANEFL